MRHAPPVVIVVLALTLARSEAQTLYVAPANSDGDRIALLTMRSQPGVLAIETRSRARGDTNVLPLLQSDRRGGSRRLFAGTSAYFDGFMDHALALRSGQWRLSYASSEATRYDGNADAAQVYLDSITAGIDPSQLARPHATMNRTSSLRWQAAYMTPIRRAPFRGRFRIAVNYLRMQRVQLGTLGGSTTGERFEGTLTFLTTLDQRPEDTRSAALSVDIDTVIEPWSRWRLALFTENLWSSVRERALQSIVADVTTNAIKPDQDGFLAGVPLLQGRIGTRYLNASLQRRVDVAAAYQDGARSWVALLRHANDRRAAAGLSASQGRSGRLWGLVWLDRSEVQLGLDTGRFLIEFGASSLDPWRANRAAISIGYRAVIGRSR